MSKKINEKSILFSFFLIFFYTSSFASSSIDVALEKKLYNSHIWKAILHVREGNPKINNKTFLLSYGNFSLKNELVKTIENFNEGKDICKYPARYLWLKEELPNNNFKEFNCSKFQNYLEKTNPEDIELIFASENVTSPSSMMGHVFFKLKSKEEENGVKQNAVSFFTVIDTFNIPLLIAKSTITGMKGFFILNPYNKQISKYLYEEKRSIWEYKLKLTDFQKKLIYYHFWELNMLSENINSEKKNEILDLFKDKKFSALKEFAYSEDLKSKDLEKEFILAYAKYALLNKNSISDEEYLYILNVVKYSEDFDIDIKKYKNPLKTFDDTQISLSYLKNDEKNSLGLSFLGASNTIFDDNREYFSESSLKIGEINLLLNKDKIHLNSINIYDMKSLIPWNNITRELSKEFRFSYEKHYDEKLEEINVLNISGGAGLSHKIHNDILIYGLGKIGTGVNFEKAYPYTSVETGLIIYEVLNMKTVLSHEFIYNQDNSNNMYQNTQINQAFFINKKIRADLNLNERVNNMLHDEVLMFKWNYFF